jgi:hypothetical protein
MMPGEVRIPAEPARTRCRTPPGKLDGERLDVDPASFDAVISRLGLIYFPDQPGAELARLRAPRVSVPVS